MKVALDGMPLASPLTGVGHYTSELAKSLALVSPNDQFELLSPRPGLLNRRWWSVGLPLHLARSSFDLFHGTNYEVPLWSRRPSVVTIHDLSLLLHPEAHEPRLVRRARWRLPLMTKAASKIITPSASVKKEICETLRVDADKVVVTPEAPRSVFARREDASDTRKRLGVQEDFVLFVGTIEPRKNLHRLLDAFEQLLGTSSLSPQLVIAGGQGWLMDDFTATIKQKRLEDRVCLTGYLHDDDLCALYSSCRVFVYPSLYEGFGLPPLEAMACGAPVIVSRIPSITETVGTAARLVDPLDTSDLSRAMAELLSDEKMRKHLAEAGAEHVKKFTWEQTALKTLEVYRQVHRFY
ncbi:MAG TPA: glycosyltransferase family 1 protein [Pyrinomonadaceae bacterium]|nr:glycosyltransferase family 1 protein [Pyrinomonadaceae bacterium]